ncbi:MAG TPA: type II toxin-antitoxin system VapC family toxin [Thermoanaerobaculia bacterium]|nr:type II toxin-antitoxin system VapC family toxin [Thermoanaerobaculia bacterium]
MKVVLDASAAVAAVAGEKKLLVAEKTLGASATLAPDLFIVEVTNGLWKYVVWEGLPVEDAVKHLRSALDMVNGFRSVAELAEEALRAAAVHRHPVYDLYYAILARREGAAILTFDKRLKQLCAEMRIPLADA